MRRSVSTNFVALLLVVILTGVLHLVICVGGRKCVTDRVCCGHQGNTPSRDHDPCRDCTFRNPIPASIELAPAIPPLALSELPSISIAATEATTVAPALLADHVRPPLLTDLVHAHCQLTT